MVHDPTPAVVTAAGATPDEALDGSASAPHAAAHREHGHPGKAGDELADRRADGYGRRRCRGERRTTARGVPMSMHHR
jgi:hypothetical protein